MLRWRLILGTLIVAALIAVCWLDHRASLPGIWLMPLAVVFAILATKEVLDLVSLAGLRPLRGTVYLGNILLVCSSWLAILQRGGRQPFDWQLNDTFHGAISLWAFWTFSALAAGVILVFLGEMRQYREPGTNIANLATGVFALVYVGVLMSFAVQLRMIWGVGALAAWVIPVKFGDTGAYAVGRLVGRHKLAPRLSPGKTIEGAVGALAASCFGSWLAFRFIVPSTTGPQATGSCLWWQWLVFGLLMGLAGMIGDLAESFLKRDVGVKDSSEWMPGFGGVLDILDSLLLSAPVAWLCWASGLVGH